MVQVVVALRSPEEIIRDFWTQLPRQHALETVALQGVCLIEREAGVSLRGAQREIVLHEIHQRLAFAYTDERKPIEFMLEVSEMAFGYCE